MWILFICTTGAWGICGQIYEVPYNSKEDCFQAMEKTIQYSEKPKTIICKPQQK